MTLSLSRRALALGSCALAVSGCASSPAPAAAATTQSLALLEASVGGRLGVFMLDTGSGQSVGRRADMRFSLCSTFKMALAGLILMEADAGRVHLETLIPLTAADMFPTHAPVAEAALPAGRISVRRMAEAVQKTSDNICANLLLRLIGGPDGFTRRVRALGDEMTRIDRYEPELNLVLPGDERDTTTPQAHARLMETLLVKDALSPSSRALLADWMVETETGLRRLRAGLPQTWRAGDKTGSAFRADMGNRTNDIAILWPPGRPAIIVTAFLETPFFNGVRDEDEAVLAAVGRLAAAWIAAGGEPVRDQEPRNQPA